MPRFTATLILTLAFMPLSPIRAQTDAQVEEQISAYRTSLRATCYAVGPEFGYTPDFVDRFCKCRIKATDESMTPEQWREFGAIMARGEIDKANQIATRILMQVTKVCAEQKMS